MAEQPLEFFKDATRSFCDVLLNQTQDAISCIDKSRKVVLWNRAAEQITGLERSETIGRHCFEDLAIFQDHEGVNICREKCPVEQTLKDGTIRSLEIYAQHKDGYRIPIALRIIPIFKESGEIIGATEIFAGTTPKLTIPLSVHELERTGLLDIDTGIPNRKYLEMQLNIRLEEFQKYGIPYGLLYIDVDNYTRVLEKYGRFNVGKLLRMIARTLHKNIRYFDIVGRWNTEEFLVLLLNIDESRMDIVANKLRLLISESYIMVETGALSTTISIGASIVQRFDTVESLLKRSEQLVLHSKWLGKNKVSMSFVQKETE